MKQNLDANDLLLFALVADTGSFSRAAERAGLPKSHVSRHIADLEEQLGERLFARSTRSLALTEFGAGLLEHARRVSDDVQAALSFTQRRQGKPGGRLRVSMPPDFSERMVLSSFFLQFATDYPDIRLELDLSARRVDLVTEQFDLAIRIANRLPDDATLVARCLSDLPVALYASPAYLARFGRPRTPAQLLEHHVALRLAASNGETPLWRLSQGDAVWEGLPEGPLTCNSTVLLLQLACHGLGVGQFTERFARQAVEEGLLERVLPQWLAQPVTVWAVTPGRRLVTARTHAFIEALRLALDGCARADEQPGLERLA